MGVDRRKTPWGVFFLLLLGMGVIAYYLCGLFLIPDITFENFQEGLLYIVQHPFKNWWTEKTPAFFGVAFLLWIMFVAWYLNYYRNTQFGVEHGSEQWANVKQLGDMTIDKRTDGTSTGHFGNASLNNDKMGRTLMTPAEIRRMPRKDCIIFLEGQYPIYDWKNLPFGTKEWKESEQLAGKEGYKNPVRVVFNKETMTYRTITSKSAIQFLDKKDVEFYKAAEKTDDTIKVFEMSEEEFLYLNWRKEPPLSEDEVAKIFEQAKMEKINPNEKVPEDVEGLSEQKKSQIGERKDHDLSGSITECIKRYIKELNQEQIDQILTGLEEGLTEKQVKTYFFLPVEKQSQYRRAYLFANKK